MLKKRIVGIVSKYEDNSLKEFQTQLLKVISEENLLSEVILRKENILLMELFKKVNKVPNKSKKKSDGFSDFELVLDGEFHYKEDLLKNIDESISEKEFLEMSYLNSGEKIFKKLSGNYSFAIYNKKDESILLARDHFGTRPLYFYKDENFFIFSSEIKYFKFFSRINISLSRKRLVEFLCQNSHNPNDTFYKEIKVLPQSHFLKFSNNSYKLKKYFHYSENQVVPKDVKSVSKKFFKLFDLAIKQRLPNTKEKKVGCLVSGGLDSSSIYSTLDSINVDPVPITMNFYNKNLTPLICDEEFYQDKLLRNNNSRLKVKFIEQSPYEKIDYYLKRFDQPFNLANAYIWDESLKAANSNHIHTVFNGVDGDTVISHGWERFKELFRPSLIHIFIKELFLFSRLHEINQFSKRPVYLKFLAPLLRENFFFKYYFKIKDSFTKKPSYQKIVYEKYIKDFSIEEYSDPRRMFRSHKNKLSNNMINIAFTNVDILTFDHQIINQSPFFDIKVVNFCKSLRSEFKLRNGKSRFVLRNSMRKIVPSEILSRYSKANLTFNFMDSINENDFMKIKYEIENMHPLLIDLIDKKLLLERYKILKKGTMSEKVSMNIWGFYLCNRWLKHHTNF